MVDTEQKVEGEVTPEAASTEAKPENHYEKKAAKKAKAKVVKAAVQPKDEGEAEDAGAEAPQAPATPETVTLISADKRVLEVSIGSQFWRGVTIDVPKELEGEVRRLLESGGFYLKN